MLTRSLLALVLTSLTSIALGCSATPEAEEEGDDAEGALIGGAKAPPCPATASSSAADVSLNNEPFTVKDVCPIAGAPMEISFANQLQGNYDVVLKVRISLQGATPAERADFKARALKGSTFKLTDAQKLTTKAWTETENPDSLFFAHRIVKVGQAKQPIRATFTLAAGVGEERTVWASAIAMPTGGRGQICGDACYDGRKCVQDACQ